MKGKGNDGLGNIPERDDWETPTWLFRILDINYNFTFDCCASYNNRKTKLFTNDFLNQPKERFKHHICWMNPPFSKVREMFEHFFNVVEKGVAIYRCDNMETKVWQSIILPNADWIFIPKGRVAYQYNPNLRNGKGTRFPSALIGKGLPEKNMGIKGTYLKRVFK